MSTDLYDVIRRRRDVRREFSDEPIGARRRSSGCCRPRTPLRAWDSPSPGTSCWSTTRDLRDRFAQQWPGAGRLRRGPGRRAGRDVRAHQGRGHPRVGAGIVVTYDPDRGSPAVLGRQAIAEPACTRPAWRSRTCGWPPPPRAASAGCRSTASRSCGAARRSRRHPAGRVALRRPGDPPRGDAATSNGPVAPAATARGGGAPQRLAADRGRTRGWISSPANRRAGPPARTRPAAAAGGAAAPSRLIGARDRLLRGDRDVLAGVLEGHLRVRRRRAACRSTSSCVTATRSRAPRQRRPKLSRVMPSGRCGSKDSSLP